MTFLTDNEIKEFIITGILNREGKYGRYLSLPDTYSMINTLALTHSDIAILLQGELQTIYDNLFINTADEDTLVRMLEDESLSRQGALGSSVTLRVGSSTLPSQTYILPQLVKISTGGETPIIFETLSEVSISGGTPQDSNGYYTVEVNAQSTTTGSNTVVIPNSITLFNTTFPGFDIVYNDSASVGGRDIESVADMRDRLKTSRVAASIGKEAWFIEKAEAFSFVNDAIVAADKGGGGLVYIYISGDSYITDLQLQEVQDEFDKDINQDLGAIFAKVYRVESVPIDIDIEVIYLDQNVTTSSVTSAITSFFSDEVRISNDFITDMFISYIINYIGRTKIQDVNLNTPTSDVNIPTGKVASLGALNITVVSGV